MNYPTRQLTLSALAILAPVFALGQAAPTPGYASIFRDATTGDNWFRGADGFRYYDVDSGADVYSKEIYERPTAQKFQFVGARYASEEYWGLLDIVRGRIGYNDRYLFVAIKVFSRSVHTKDWKNDQKGLVERYGFRIGRNFHGRRGWLFTTDQPELKNGFAFGTIGNSGYRDTDGDVGGRGVFSGSPSGRHVSKTVNPQEEDGMTGYETLVIQDGKINETRNVLWSRVNPNDNREVEMILDYRAFGMTRDIISNLAYFELEAVKGGPKDPQNYLWNDKYTAVEAGSPNPGTNGRSEFGTEGCDGIYELDTLRIR